MLTAFLGYAELTRKISTDATASHPQQGSDRESPTSSSSKLYKCPHCAVELSEHYDLKSHLFIHTAKKPYVCETCDSRFNRLHDLKRHSRLHTDGISYDESMPPRGARSLLLECPFKAIIGCLAEFGINDEDLWIKHSFGHFKINGKRVEPPRTNKCCFCVKEFLENTGEESWILRLKHVRRAHYMNDHWIAAARPDFELARYSWGAHLIGNAEFRNWTAEQGYSIPPSSQSSKPLIPVDYPNARRNRGDRVS